MTEMKRIREAQVVHQVGDQGGREPVAMLPIANLGLRLTAQLTFADDQWSAYCPELDLATASDADESAVRDLAQLAIEYAAEYLADFDLYVNRGLVRTDGCVFLTAGAISEDHAGVLAPRHRRHTGSVFFITKPNDAALVISAREMDAKERRQYERK